MPTDTTNLATVNPQLSALAFVEEQLVAYISREGIAPGVMLPSYQQLGRRFGVSAVTVQRAVARLVASGLLRSEHRRGTFVAGGAGASRLSPSEAAGSLSSDDRRSKHRPLRTLTIGLVADLPPPADDFQWSDALWSYLLVSSVERAVSEKVGVTLHFGNLAGPGSTTRPTLSVIDSLVEDGVDGIIVYAPSEASNLNAILRCASSTPLVIVSAQPVVQNVAAVYFDDVNGGFTAARHMIAQGYRRIYYCAPFTANWVKDRLTGIRQALYECAGEIELTVFVDESGTPNNLDQQSAAERQARRWLRSVEPGSGIIAANDNVAHAILGAANELGWLPGQDYGLMGFDDLRYSRDKGITSMHPPIEKMGHESVNLILRILEAGAGTIKQAWLPQYLIQRASTKPLAMVEPG